MSDDVLLEASRIVSAEATRAAREPATHIRWRVAHQHEPSFEGLWRRTRAWWALLPDAEKQQLLLIASAVLADLLAVLIRHLFPDPE